MLGFSQIRRSEQGFTLVELAIVLVIIGLLITGLLKGAELINNARVKSTLQQFRSLDAAITTFRDNYRYYPGDLGNASTRLPNCTLASCSTVVAPQVSQDGFVGDPANTVAANYTAATVANDERLRFFAQLAAADLIGGVNLNAGAVPEFGDGYLQTAMGNSGFVAGTINGAAAIGAAAANSRAGLYIYTLASAISQPVTNPQFRPVDAQAIDLKLDDGNPTTGSVVAGGVVGTCWTAAAAPNPAVYRTVNTTGCNIVSRVQN